jgi:hypothetical protein
MSALAELQQKCAEKTETQEVTGILPWGLSAAFDGPDCNILCQKLESYGFNGKTANWFSFSLSNRTQRLRKEDVLSQLENVVSGVLHGGIISPLLYTICVADLQIWLKHVSAITYADDMSTSVSHKQLSNSS